MVKLDLTTLSAPVTWIGPGGKADGAWVGGSAGFLDFAAVLLGGVTGFLEVFELEDLGVGFFPFGETLAALVVGDFLLLALTGVVDAGAAFSELSAGSFSIWAFSLCISSSGGAENQGQDPTFKNMED